MSLNRHARAAISELAGLGVHDCTPDEIVALHILGERLDRAGESVAPSCRGVLPVRCGNAILWPMTCAGNDWWEMAKGWFRGEKMLSAALGFCLAHGRDPERLLSLYDPQDAARALSKWFRGLSATLQELEQACETAYAIEADSARDSARLALAELFAWRPDKEAALRAIFPDLCPAKSGAEAPDREPAAFFWRGYCAELAALCGGSPAEWYGRDRRETVRAYATAVEALAVRAFAPAPSQSNPVTDAIRALRHQIAEILERRRTATPEESGPCPE